MGTSLPQTEQLSVICWNALSPKLLWGTSGLVQGFMAFCHRSQLSWFCRKCHCRWRAFSHWTPLVLLLVPVNRFLQLKLHPIYFNFTLQYEKIWGLIEQFTSLGIHFFGPHHHHFHLTHFPDLFLPRRTSQTACTTFKMLSTQ